jgi:hypothetical protein
MGFSAELSTGWVLLKLLFDVKEMGCEDVDWIQLAQA